jgi:hypothetical protein
MKLALGCSVDIGEVIYYNTALTASDSNTVCEYLKNKWVPQDIAGVFGVDYTTAFTIGGVSTPSTINIKMSKTIATDLTGTTITFSDGSNSMNITGITKTTNGGNSYYSFTFTPTFATTTGKFTITNAKDSDNNIVPSIISQANLTINPIDHLAGAVLSSSDVYILSPAVLTDLLVSTNTRNVVSWNGMVQQTFNRWVQISFATPKRLISLNQVLSAGSGNNTWRGSVIGIDEAGNQTVINSSVPFIGTNPHYINSPQNYKAYRLQINANTTPWGNDPAIIRWESFVFA